MMEQVLEIASPTTFGPMSPARSKQDRAFLIAFGCATLLHSMFLLGLLGSPPRILGERDGSPETLNVDVIDAATLASLGVQASPGAPEPVESIVQPPPPPPVEPSPPAPQPPLRQTQPPAAQTSAPQPGAPKASEAALLEKEMPELFALPSDPAGKQGKSDQTAKETNAKDGGGPKAPPAKDQSAKDAAKELTKALTSQQPSQQQPNQKASQSKSLANLDLSMPKKMPGDQMTFTGNSAAASRPSDITRSGENDDFGRGVILALRTTMPAPYGIKGKTTIRLLLNERGNVAELRLANSSGFPHLDQSVLFAAKQASFPLPPKGATVSDRTFLVTYVYN